MSIDPHRVTTIDALHRYNVGPEWSRAEVVDLVKEIERLRRGVLEGDGVATDLIERLTKIHRRDEEEAEWWADGVDPEGHDRRFPDCPGVPACEGHTAMIPVCRECGYEHDGDSAYYRGWPCPTLLALAPWWAPTERVT